MTRTDIFNKAEEFGMDRTQALKFRLSYVREKISDNKKFLEELENDVKGSTGLTKAFLEQSIQTTKNQIVKLQKQHSRLVTPSSSIQGITDDDVQAAREHPVENLMDFGRSGRCRAFCHKSNTESMAHNKRDNKVMCFVCNKSFNPIDVLVERDGYEFIEAVKELK